jgi:hypothetical protein
MNKDALQEPLQIEFSSVFISGCELQSDSYSASHHKLTANTVLGLTVSKEILMKKLP